MSEKNNLDKVALATVDDNELKRIKDLESELNDKYYLIAFKKE